MLMAEKVVNVHEQCGTDFYRTDISRLSMPCPRTKTCFRFFDSSSKSVREIFLEDVIEPLSRLNYDDFTLSNLLKSGVSYQSLRIDPDLRLGFDSEIDAFNSRLEELVKNFNV